MSLMAMARAEREDLAAFLATLSPGEWDGPTLCEGWRVRDVVAHMLSYDELDRRGLLRRLVRGRFLLGRANHVGVADYAGHSPDDLLALLNRCLEPRGLTAARGGLIALLDGTIHHQDIRRPLGRQREIPADRLPTVLSAAMTAPPLRAFWRCRGLRLVAEDVEWSHGKGAEVRGNGEALLMAAAGRKGVVAELSGPGQPTLAARIG